MSDKFTDATGDQHDHVELTDSADNVCASCGDTPANNLVEEGRVKNLISVFSENAEKKDDVTGKTDVGKTDVGQAHDGNLANIYLLRETSDEVSGINRTLHDDGPTRAEEAEDIEPIYNVMVDHDEPNEN